MGALLELTNVLGTMYTVSQREYYDEIMISFFLPFSLVSSQTEL